VLESDFYLFTEWFFFSNVEFLASEVVEKVIKGGFGEDELGGFVEEGIGIRLHYLRRYLARMIEENRKLFFREYGKLLMEKCKCK
jgi:hypothetical protein